MAIIQVYRHERTNERPIGTGEGSLDTRAKTATIEKWRDPAALQSGQKYSLRTGGTIYSAECTSRTLPVTFKDVV